MSQLTVAWSFLGAAEREALAALANAGSQLVRALGASQSFPTVFASSSPQTLSQWESAYEAARATVAGPTIETLAGQGGAEPSSGVTDWASVFAGIRETQVRNAARAIEQAHAASRASGGQLAAVLSDGSIRAWLASRGGRDAALTPAPAVMPASSGGSTALLVIAALAIAASGRRR